LLLTHVGPDGSGTALCYRDTAAPPIRTGSTALRGFLCRADMQQLLVCAVHGHTHAGGGRGHIGAVPVLNPGPLRDGEYALLTLRREAAGPPPASSQPRWYMAAYEMLRLPGSLATATLAS
jgi:Icc-related predicted phosphoesterase